MQKNLSLVLAFAGLLFVISACNIYKPFASSTGEQAYLDKAQECLHGGDYDCAIENFLKLSDGEQKEKKLCTAYLGRAGVTLNVLLNVVTQNNSEMIGALANALVPYTAAKLADAESARTHCANYGALPGTGDTGVMLLALGYMTDCGTRVAKTDQIHGANDGDPVCTTSVTPDGEITKSDINTAGPTMMCSTDVTECSDDFAAIDAGAVGGAGLSELSGALGQVPGAITGGADVTAKRVGIAAAIPN